MLIDSTKQLHIIRNELHNKTVGFAPTMGNLHAGHLGLVEESLKNNDVTFVSIFVNPTQFGPNEDYDKYPRTLKEDFAKIEALAKNYENKEIWIYAPKSVSEIYPEDWDTKIEVPELSNRLCGKSRPGHFSGVCTVVYRLFSLIRPNNSYFGKKDFQQCLIIQKMVTDLMLPVTINMMPIAREKDGLALSSRNQYLNPVEREQALELNQTINKIKNLIEEKDYISSLAEVEALKTKKLTDLRWEYLEILDAQKLTAPTENSQSFVILGAFKLGQTRLIDNVEVKC